MMGGMAVGMKDECGETRQEALRRGGGTALIGQGRIRGRRYWRGLVRLTVSVYSGRAHYFTVNSVHHRRQRRRQLSPPSFRR